MIYIYKSMARKVFRRRPKRRFIKRKFGAKRRYIKRKRDSPTKVVTKTLGGFPDRFFCKLKTIGEFTPAASVSGYISWHSNSFGPNNAQNVNNTGYNSIYPSGLKFLLGASTDNPAVAPYGSYRIWGSVIKVRYTPTGAGPVALTCCLFPSYGPNDDAPSIGASTLSTIGEQPYVKVGRVNGNNTGRGLLMKHMISTRRMSGLKHKAAIEGNQGFVGIVGTPPLAANLTHWNFYIFGDSATNLTGRVEWELIQYIELFDRNCPYTSQPPV